MLYGREALEAAGFPLEIANFFCGKIFTYLYHGKPLDMPLTTLRSGQKPNIDKGIRVAFKSMDVKTKTCNDDLCIPLLSGFIPMNQALFGRQGSKHLPDNIPSV